MLPSLLLPPTRHVHPGFSLASVWTWVLCHGPIMPSGGNVLTWLSAFGRERHAHLPGGGEEKLDA